VQIAIDIGIEIAPLMAVAEVILLTLISIPARRLAIAATPGFPSPRR